MILNWKIKPYWVKIYNTKSEVEALMEAVSKKIKPEEYQNIDLNIFDEYVEYEFTENTSIIFIEEDKVKRLIGLSEFIGFKIDVKEVTKELFEGEYEFSKEHEEFFLLLDEYLQSNFDADDVLDKILRKGMDSLTDTDKSILKGKH